MIKAIFGSGFIIILIWMAAVIGEVMCIVKFFSSDFEPSYKREMIYGFSAITGVGCITGWMDFPDTIYKDQVK